MGIKHTSDDTRSRGTTTPIQQTCRQGPLDHSPGVSRLNTTPLERSFNSELQGPNRALERQPSDTVTISSIKRAAGFDSKSFLHINNTDSH